MIDLPDDPIISNIERSGYPGGTEPPLPVCPICGEECETVYRESGTANILGCNNCLIQEDAWECHLCFPGEE